jgi:hypothetical protein
MVRGEGFVDNKAIISIVALTLFLLTMPHRATQAAEQNNGTVSPAVTTSDSKSTAADNGTPSEPVADLAEGKKVQEALDQLIHAYETGNIGLIQSSIDPTMMGYQRLLDGIRQDVISLRQIRVELLNTQVVVGPDVAVIQTDWEKRFLAASSLSPGLFTGHSIFLMHRGESGWQMAGFSGDNLFAGQGGTLGQISTVPTVVTLVIGVGPPTGNVQITVVDPDLANRSSLTVQVTAAQGDRESVVLTATTPGRFTGSLTVINQSTFSAGDGIIEVQGTPTTIFIRYLDNNPGNNRPPSMLTKIVPVR